MNARLKELAERAGFCGTGFHNTLPGTTQEDALKNFAELIVRDCAELADNNYTEYLSNGELILRDFGFK